jgi:hypothetical protein
MRLPLNVARRLALDRALRREVENISIISEDRVEYKPGSVQSREDLLEMTSENDSENTRCISSPEPLPSNLRNPQALRAKAAFFDHLN